MTRKTTKNSLMKRSTAKKLNRAITEFDREFVAETFKPLDASSDARWRRAKRKVGRPRQGEGVKAISLSIEKSLLRRADRVARQQGISRARLISNALKQALAG